MAGEDFGAAFDTLIRADATPPVVAKDVPNPPTPPVTPPAAEAPPAAAQTETPPAPPAGEGDEPVTELETPDEPETPEPPPPPEPKGATDDALARLADMLSQRQPPPPQQRVEAPAPPPPAFNEQETQFLTQYSTDFPDVMRAEALIRRAEYNALTSHIFREMASYFAPHIALLGQLADNAAYSAVTQKVPNYDALRDQVTEWVKTQPAYLQGGMNHVIEAGTAEEISDLFGRFQQATGTAAPNPQSGVAPANQGGQAGAPPPAAKPAAELSPAAKQAAARLAPVTGKRSAPTQIAPPDFNAAFDQFAKELT